MTKTAEKVQRIAALGNRTKSYDWHTDELHSPGHVTIVFRDPRAAKAMRKAVAILLSRKPLIHKGCKP